MNYDFYFLNFPETKLLFSILSENGIEARFVGGCVRDSILGLKNSDLDIAINADIQSVENLLSRNGIKCIPTGLKYGSITAIVNHRHFELTTLRKDEECFGRDCITTEVCSFEEDAKRRDFTMNARYVSQKGELFDYFGGVNDLKKREVIFIGNAEKRITEDYLRILRYYRFCAKYGDTGNRYNDILTRQAQHLKKLSIERIQKEILLILDSKYYLEIIKIMANNNILIHIFKNLNLENLEKTKNLVCSLECRLYLLFDFEDLAKTLKLTRIQKKKITDYKSFEQESLEYCYYKKGTYFLNDMVSIKHAKFDMDILYLPKIDIYQTFPLKFQDLPEGITNAGKKLKICEKWWVNTGCIKTREECLEYVSSIN